ncbi:DUF3592 domain-containing protein [Streptomyces sp. NPDC090022]|uniref:DUF3592 domain-containing protein n=1 Tax=Streptomyces sp. NPDC090022 TaxID=3365920 RepID=UPI0037FBF4E7
MLANMGGESKEGASGTHPQSTTAGLPTSRGALLTALVIALLLGALSVLVMYPAARHLRSLQDGKRAEATLVSGGSCILGGRCQVEFEADGRTVVSYLPLGSGGGKSVAGERLTVRYEAADPQVVASENDVNGGGAAVLAVTSGASALIFLGLAGSMAITRRRRGRRPAELT